VRIAIAIAFALLAISCAGPRVSHTHKLTTKEQSNTPCNAVCDPGQCIMGYDLFHGAAVGCNFVRADYCACMGEEILLP